MPPPSFQEFYDLARQYGAADPVPVARQKYIEKFGGARTGEGFADVSSAWKGPTREQFRSQARINAERMGVEFDQGKADDVYEENFGRGLVGEFGAGLARGAFQMGDILSTTMHALGLPGFEPRPGPTVGEKLSTPFTRSPAARGDVFDQPAETLTNPLWWASSMGEIAPSMAASMGTGLGLYAAGAGPLASALGMGLTAGHMEAADKLREDMLAGDPQAWSTYAKNAAGVGLINMAPGAAMFSKMGLLPRMLSTGFMEGLTETAEEPYMAMVAGEDPVEAAKRGLNVFPPAFVMGMLGGAGTAKLDQAPAPEATQELTPETIQAPQTAEDIIKGKWETGKLIWSPVDDQNVGPAQSIWPDEAAGPRAESPALRYGVATEQNIVNPIDPALPPQEKAEQLRALGEASSPIVKDIMGTIDQRFGTKSGDNFKAIENIVSKANRPSIKAKKPWHDVEHIRDSYRFKTVLEDATTLPGIFEELNKRGIEIVKTDTDKLLNPGAWGWRIAAFDLRMPNGLLVEYYTPVKELEAAKKGGGHQLFEKWRNEDLDRLTPEQSRQMQNDILASKRLYQGAWDRYLKRSGQSDKDILASLTSLAASSGPGQTKSLASSSADQGTLGDQLPPTREALTPSSRKKTSPERLTTTTGESDIGITSTGIVPSMAESVYQDYDNTDVTYKVKDEDGAEYEISENAGAAIRDIDKRIAALQEVRRKCL